MLISIHGVKLYAHCYTWREALCSLPLMCFAHWYTWSEALSSILYKV